MKDSLIDDTDHASAKPSIRRMLLLMNRPKTAWSFMHLLDQVEDFSRRILQIVIKRDDIVACAVLKSAEESRMLPIVRSRLMPITLGFSWACLCTTCQLLSGLPSTTSIS